MGREVIFARVNNEIVACVNTFARDNSRKALKAQLRARVYRVLAPTGQQDW
jgi:hypothetical protein